MTVVSVRHSSTGPVVDSGAAQLWRATDADIEVSGSVDDAVTVTVADGGDAPAAELSFAAARGATLTPGSYENAQRVANRTAGHAGVHYNDDDLCTSETGRFTVVDISADLSRLDVVYEISCENRSDAVIGEIRVGEPGDGSGLTLAPTRIAWPDTCPGLESRAVPVTMVNTGTAPVTVGSAAVTSGSDSFAIADDPC